VHQENVILKRRRKDRDMPEEIRRGKKADHIRKEEERSLKKREEKKRLT